MSELIEISQLLDDVAADLSKPDGVKRPTPFEVLVHVNNTPAGMLATALPRGEDGDGILFGPCLFKHYKVWGGKTVLTELTYVQARPLVGRWCSWCNQPIDENHPRFVE